VLKLTRLLEDARELDLGLRRLGRGSAVGLAPPQRRGQRRQRVGGDVELLLHPALKVPISIPQLDNLALHDASKVRVLAEVQFLGWVVVDIAGTALARQLLS